MNKGIFGENFPYTNFHDLNLDWIIKTMRGIADQLEDFSKTASDAETAINTTAQTAIDSIETEKEDAIREIEDTISGFSVKHRLILLADSYGGRVDSENRTLLQLVQNYMQIPNEDFYGSYVPGAAFAHQYTAGKFITQLENASISDPDTVTDIVVICGANDANYYVQDTTQAISQFYTYAKNNYKRAKVIIVGAGLTFTPDGIYIKNRAVEAYINSTSFGVIYAQNCEYVLMNTYYLESDRCHPNQIGVPIVARAVTNAITSYSCNSRYIKTFGEATETEYLVTPSLRFESIAPSQLTIIDPDISKARMQLINGHFDLVSANDSPLFSCRFNLNEVEFTPTQNTISYEIANTLFIGKLIVNGTVLTPVGIGTMVDLDDTSNNCPCKILFEYDDNNNKFYLRFKPVGSFTLTQNNLAIYGSMSFHM